MPNARHIPKGQTLLELVVSIGVIVACVVTILGLVLSTTRVTNASKSQILASNLAREGVEIARSVRDNNWLLMDSGQPVSWNSNLYDDQGGFLDFTAIAVFIPPKVSQPPPTGGTWIMSFNQDQIGQDRTELYFHPVLGLYAQTDDINGCAQGPFCCPHGSLCGFGRIQYWRLVYLNPICWPIGEQSPTQNKPEFILPENTPAGTDDPCTRQNALYEEVGIQVRSRVQWVERGRTHNVEVVDRLFNWKP